MRGDFEEFMIKTSAEREPGVEVVPQEIPERYAQLIAATDVLATMKRMMKTSGVFNTKHK